ncbi:MAG: DNA-3-methyladenine glycosylase family protein [Nanobdellota archaeon]
MQFKVTDFSLENTLECGQFFRFKKEGDAYLVQVRDKAFYARQESDTVFIAGTSDKRFIRHLFRLDEDFTPIKKALMKDPHTRASYEAFPGIRLMRQDPWECTVSYICSQVSNIPKIRSSLEQLSQSFGTPFRFNNQILYSFPEPGTLTCNKTMRACGIGFRADYLQALNTEVKAGLLTDLDTTYPQARDRLMRCKGIGEKVADCILLFSKGYDEAFPVDVWVRRAMHKHYLQAPDKELREFMVKRFSGYAGYAQQYLFMHTRLTS